MISLSCILFLLSAVEQNFAKWSDKIFVNDSEITIKYGGSNNGLSSEFTHTIAIAEFSNISSHDCSDQDPNNYCVAWGSFARLRIHKSHCEYFDYSTSFDKPLNVYFDISNVHVYGATQHSNQQWPAEKQQLPYFPYVSQELNFQCVLEPYFLVSSGYYIYVDQTVPLFISMKDNVLQLTADRKAPYIREETRLKYTVCRFDDVKIAHQHALANVLGKPSDLPDLTMVKYPVWTTWAKYKANINQDIVLAYANLIKKHKFPNSQLEIDDNWERCYGSVEIDRKRFPNMKELVRRLKSMGFRVTIWVHPFVNDDCEDDYTNGTKLGYFVQNQDKSTFTTWWNGNASYIDYTNPEAVSWYKNKLDRLKSQTDVDSFKFDGGPSSYNPQIAIFHTMEADHPETNLKLFVDTAASYGSMVEVRVGRGTQKYPIFVRMMDRNSNWGYDLGLRSLVTTLLQMNIIGYPYVLPDMVGGNAYNGAEITPELFIRWLQANVFMPVLQFSVAPWEYGPDVTEIAGKYVELHSNYSDKIIEAMRKTVEDGTPVNPPIWWIDPHDPVALTIDSEFLLGEDMLIAPVLEEGAKQRDIYLPKGRWKDESNNIIIQGPVWLNNYSAPLDTLPYFTKVNSALFQKPSFLIHLMCIFLINLLF